MSTSDSDRLTEAAEAAACIWRLAAGKEEAEATGFNAADRAVAATAGYEVSDSSLIFCRLRLLVIKATGERLQRRGQLSMAQLQFSAAMKWQG